ncbi:MAG: ExbD/TolR family protein [Phycisphaerae bacterium]
MKYRARRQQTSVGLGFNATPMVDVIFMLTIFFMLVSRLSEAELVPMKLPDPEKSRASVDSVPDRVIINCQMSEDSEGEVLYSIGPNQPEPLTVITDRMLALKQDSPDVKVVIRADRRLPYEPVRIVMRALANAGVEVLNVSAHTNDGGP